MSDRVLKTKDDELKQANWKVKAIEEEVRCAEEKARAESSKHNRELIELYDRVSELIGDEDDQGDPPYMCKLNCPWVVNQATFLLAPRGFCLVLHDLYSHLWWKNAIAWKAPISMVIRDAENAKGSYPYLYEKHVPLLVATIRSMQPGPGDSKPIRNPQRINTLPLLRIVRLDVVLHRRLDAGVLVHRLDRCDRNTRVSLHRSERPA